MYFLSVSLNSNSVTTSPASNSTIPPTKPVSLRVVDDYIPFYDHKGQQPPSGQLDKSQYNPYNLLYGFYDKMPELRGIATGIVEDIMSEGYELVGDEAKIKKMRRFMRRNRFTKKLHAALLDFIITGNGYLGKASVTDAQIENVAKKCFSKYMQKSASSDDITIMKTMAKLKYPDIHRTQVLFGLKSKNMRIDYDMHGNVEYYVQRVMGGATVTMGVSGQNPDTGVQGSRSAGNAVNEIKFRSEEVIHFAYEPVGDDIYGSSPFLPALSDAASLKFSKRYGGKFFENDATPSRLYIMEDESPQSPNVRRMEDELLKHKKQPHKNMIATGRIEVVRIGSDNKDLEFGQFMDKYLRHVMISTGSIFKYQFIWTGKGTRPEMIEPYYKKINLLQTEIEDELNTEFFDTFGLEFTFRKTYKRDESREADIVNKLVGKPVLTINEGREYLGHPKKPGKKYDVILDNTQKTTTNKDPKSSEQAIDSRQTQNENNPSASGVPKQEEDA